MQNAKERLCAEAISTFCLVFAGTGAVVVDQLTGGHVTGLGISLVFGLIVLAMIYTVGHVSGAHMNPAVTAAFCAAGRHKLSEFLPYALAQLAGALAASAALRALFGNGTSLGVTMPAGSEMQSFILEFILTFMLMFTVMGVATDDRAEGAMAGIAIGGLIAVEAIFAGPICGASMNPTRSLAPALVSGNLSHIWIYLTAPTLGAIAGALAYRLIKEPSAA